MGCFYLKCNITFADIPEDKLRHFKRKNGTEDTALNFTIVKRKTTDVYGNTHCIYVSQTKEEVNRKDQKIFIGTGKLYELNNDKNNNNPPIEDEDIPF